MVKPQFDPQPEPHQCLACGWGNMERFVPVEGKARVNPKGEVELYDLEELTVSGPVMLECSRCGSACTERFYTEVTKSKREAAATHAQRR